MIETSPSPVDVVPPCLDETEALPWVLERIPPSRRGIVVDNWSTDGSADITRALGAYVVHEPRRGFGAACHAGLSAATADVVCFRDCDASLDPDPLPRVARPVLGGSADLVLGRHRPAARGARPVHARPANLGQARLIRRRTRLHPRHLGPMRVVGREVRPAPEPTDRRTGHPLQTVLRATDAGWRVYERDVPYHLCTGRSKGTATWQAVSDMRATLAQQPVTGAVR